MQPSEQLATGMPRCRHCGLVLGVYEPLVCIVGGIARRSSRAADPEVVSLASACYHADSCAPQPPDDPS